MRRLAIQSSKHPAQTGLPSNVIDKPSQCTQICKGRRICSQSKSCERRALLSRSTEVRRTGTLRSKNMLVCETVCMAQQGRGLYKGYDRIVPKLKRSQCYGSQLVWNMKPTIRPNPKTGKLVKRHDETTLKRGAQQPSGASSLSYPSLRSDCCRPVRCHESARRAPQARPVTGTDDAASLGRGQVGGFFIFRL